MSRHSFILVPADTPHGPVKGAYALANALVATRPVTLVTLRRGPGAESPLDPAVARACLEDQGARSLRGAVIAYRALLRAAGTRSELDSTSMCFSADLVNGFCRDLARTCASVRGNLFMNYRLDYGLPGLGLAAIHLAWLRRFGHVVAMTQEMSRQVRRWSGRTPAVIGNFVDEAALEPWRQAARPPGPGRIVFVGSLSRRKRPELLLDAAERLHAQGTPVTVDFVGGGPLEPLLRERIGRRADGPRVTLHGFVPQPLEHVATADVFVLPSLSEGLSRAALEALHLGVPVVLRDADGNRELVDEGRNGRLFTRDADLAGAIAAELARPRAWPRPSLLPPTMRQRRAADAFSQLLQT